MAEDYYSILGVGRNSSLSEIKTAYLRLAREYHPDRVRDPDERTEASRRFQLINESFNHLRDEKLRREYDRSLEDQAIPPEEKAAQHHRDGQLLEQSRDYSEALKYYYEASRLDPENPSYIVAVARILGKDRSKQRQAAELLEQILAKAPQTRDAYLELGGLYSQSGLFTRACRVYETALQELPGDTEIRWLLSQARAAARRAKK